MSKERVEVKSSKADLTDVVTRQEWLEAARLSLGLAPTDDLRLLEVRGVPAGDGSEDIQGFIGETLPVRVRVRVGDEGEKEVALFLKTVPRDNALRISIAIDSGAFRKECGYFELMERLSPCLPAPHRLPPPWAPRCFLARETALVFEDLGVQGYKTRGMRNCLDFEHCAAALDALARLHAASLALEETDRRARGLEPWRLGDRFKVALEEIILAPIIQKFISMGINSIQTIISLIPKYKNSPRYKEILDKVENTVTALHHWSVKPSDKYRNVLLHGDIWINNIMFKHSAGGEVEEARLVDFQSTRYGPPSLDVEMLLALSLRRQLREERGDELRDCYYAALRSALQRAGVDPDDLMPRAHFDACRRQGEALGFGIGAVYFPTDYLPSEVARAVQASPDEMEAMILGKRSDLLRAAFALNNDYRDRIGELVEDFVEKVLLDNQLKF